MENELMDYEVMDEIAVQETEQPGLSTGGAIAIGAGITLAAIAVGKFVKKLWNKHKAKMEAEQVEGEGDVIDVEVVK